MHTPIVRLSGVTFRWSRRQGPVLTIPEFKVSANERLFIHGPSGSGKTTLLNLIAGVAHPEEGDVQVLGQNLSQLAHARCDAFRSDHIGLIFQMFNLVPYLSLMENVVLPCRFSSRRYERATTNGLDLEATATRLLSELGLDADRLSSRPVSELSAGQQQRVAVARALIGAPELIIADEPTSSLDADAQEAFLQLLFNEVSDVGATLLFVSHDRRLEERFDRAISLPEINKALATPVDRGNTI